MDNKEFYNNWQKEGLELLAEKGKTIASEFFETMNKFHTKEDALTTVLAGVFPARWDDYSADWYDNSLEVYGKGLLASQYELDLLFHAGFSIVWIHDHLKDDSTRCSCRAATKEK